MKKSVVIRIMIAFCIILVLAACGGKSQESVTAKLEEKLGAMDGYKAKAEMKMQTGQTEQKYEIDVWYKKKDYYRVELNNNQDQKGGQVILKNEDGVFVLTPALNKSFKFQTDWPENSSQPYLYQSLIRDVLKDKEAEFKATDDHYIFNTKTNYQSNNNLPYQEIYFNKKDYTPVLVKVLDKDKNALVEVKFASFDTSPSFKEGDFKTKENMTSSASVSDIPVSGKTDVDSFSVIFPMHTAGAELTERKEVELEHGQRVILTFTGEKSFTLVQETAEALETFSTPEEVKGDILNLGHTIGIISENVIEWSMNGVDFMLASDELTKEELIEVAQSVQGKEVDRKSVV